MTDRFFYIRLYIEPFEAALKVQFDLQSVDPIEFHYVENNSPMFSSSTLISLQLKKERHEKLNFKFDLGVN